jgi:hypothetical protein
MISPREALMSLIALAAIPLAHAEEGAGYALGCADTMEKVFRDVPWQGRPAEKLAIEAARNEVEGIQLLVIAGKGGIRSATVEVSDLTAEAGEVIPKSVATWNVVGYVKTEKPNYPTPRVGWWPDPLLDGKPFDVREGEVQPIWLNVRIPQEAKSGLYRGTVTVRPEGRPAAALPLEVRVWNFAIPKQQHLESCFLLRPDELKQFYKLPAVPIEMFERWMDICLDHRLSLTLNDWPEWDKDMERLVERQLSRGGSAFCLGGAWFQQGKPEDRAKHNAGQVAALQKLYDRAKARGWLPKAYVYCHDEIGKEQYLFARELYGALDRKSVV